MTHEIVKDWTTEAGYRAAVLRVDSGVSGRGIIPDSWFCGYVGIPSDHPFFGKSDSDDSGFKLSDDTPIGKRGIISVLAGTVTNGTQISDLFNVHGSLTYSSGHEAYPVATGRGTVWWFGFDCHHYRDDPRVQNAKYTEMECESLAAQLAEYAKKPTDITEFSVGGEDTSK